MEEPSEGDEPKSKRVCNSTTHNHKNNRSVLPTDLICRVREYLDFHSSYPMALTCVSWHTVWSSSLTWRRMVVNRRLPAADLLHFGLQYKNLMVLDLTGDVVDNALIRRLLDRITALKELRLSKCAISDFALQSLARSSSRHHLQALYLDGCSVTPQGVRFVCAACPKLSTLHLLNFGGQGIEHINCPSLTEVVIHGRVPVMGMLSHLPNLISFTLEGDAVAPSATQTSIPIPIHLRSLKVIGFADNYMGHPWGDGEHILDALTVQQQFIGLTHLELWGTRARMSDLSQALRKLTQLQVVILDHFKCNPVMIPVLPHLHTASLNTCGLNGDSLLLIAAGWRKLKNLIFTGNIYSKEGLHALSTLPELSKVVLNPYPIQILNFSTIFPSTVQISIKWIKTAEQYLLYTLRILGTTSENGVSLDTLRGTFGVDAQQIDALLSSLMINGHAYSSLNDHFRVTRPYSEEDDDE